MRRSAGSTERSRSRSTTREPWSMLRPAWLQAGRSHLSNCPPWRRPYIHVRPIAHGCPTVTETQARESVGRSRGGPTTKIHTLTDGRCRSLLRGSRRGRRGHSAVDCVAGSGPDGPARARTGTQASEVVNRRPGLLVTGEPQSLAGRTHHGDDPAAADQIANRLREGRNGGRPPGFDPAAYKRPGRTRLQTGASTGVRSPPATTGWAPTSRSPSTSSRCSTGYASNPMARIYQTQSS